MPRKRRVFDGTFQAKVALDALRGLKSVGELASQHTGQQSCPPPPPFASYTWLGMPPQSARMSRSERAISTADCPAARRSADSDDDSTTIKRCGV